MTTEKVVYYGFIKEYKKAILKQRIIIEISSTETGNNYYYIID